MILLYRENEDWRVPLTVRPAHMRDHAGQISFPGGMQDGAESSQEAALRELDEELSVDTDSVKIVGRLSDIYVYNSNFFVTPWVAISETPVQFRPNTAEVAEWFGFPVSELCSEPKIGSIDIVRGGLKFSAPTIQYERFQVWGATSMILAEFREFLRRN